MKIKWMVWWRQRPLEKHLRISAIVVCRYPNFNFVSHAHRKYGRRFKRRLYLVGNLLTKLDARNLVFTIPILFEVLIDCHRTLPEDFGGRSFATLSSKLQKFWLLPFGILQMCSTIISTVTFIIAVNTSQVKIFCDKVHNLILYGLIDEQSTIFFVNNNSIYEHDRTSTDGHGYLRKAWIYEQTVRDEKELKGIQLFYSRENDCPKWLTLFVIRLFCECVKL